MSKGFTLLELLIVIAILAILTTVVVLVLNPAEYLAQARDSQRLSDLNTLNSAVSLYLSTVNPITWNCITAPNAYCTFGVNSSTAATSASSSLCYGVSSSTAVGGTGWLPLNFSNIPGSSPIARLPIDPTNTATLKYAYNCLSASNTYEIDAKMESAKYKASGQSDVESRDGGNASSTYEIGTDLTIIN